MAQLRLTGEPDPEPSPPSEYTADFMEFWQTYPRRIAKRAAFKAWQLACRRAGKAHILERARVFAASPRGLSGTAPMAATWLNQDRFDDDPNEWDWVPGREESAW